MLMLDRFFFCFFLCFFGKLAASFGCALGPRFYGRVLIFLTVLWTVEQLLLAAGSSSTHTTTIGGIEHKCQIANHHTPSLIRQHHRVLIFLACRCSVAALPLAFQALSPMADQQPLLQTRQFFNDYSGKARKWREQCSTYLYTLSHTKKASITYR